MVRWGNFGKRNIGLNICLALPYSLTLKVRRADCLRNEFARQNESY
jgi:hypothetical protein